MKGHLITSILMLILIASCKQKETQKTESVEVKPRAELIAEPKKKINEKLLIEQISINTSEKNTDLFNKIKSLDSLFFDVAYNKCDTVEGRKLVSKDFEFYHDQGGTLLNEPNALASDIIIEDLSWICNDTHRKLVTNSMEVFPLYEENELYGAIQQGDHQFYKVVDKIPTELKVNAKFIHLWILEDNDWKLKRVFSFDHQKVIKN